MSQQQIAVDFKSLTFGRLKQIGNKQFWEIIREVAVKQPNATIDELSGQVLDAIQPAVFMNGVEDAASRVELGIKEALTMFKKYEGGNIVPTDDDVLFGSGNGLVRHHPGRHRLKALMVEFLLHRHSITSKQFVDSVIALMYPCRFLKNSGFGWYKAEESDVRLKINKLKSYLLKRQKDTAPPIESVDIPESPSGYMDNEGTEFRSEPTADELQHTYLEVHASHFQACHQIIMKCPFFSFATDLLGSIPLAIQNCLSKHAPGISTSSSTMQSTKEGDKTITNVVLPSILTLYSSCQ